MEVGLWISAEDMAQLSARGIPGLPGTARGCRDKAQREGWPSKRVQGKGGPGGVKTVFQPPPAIAAAISALGDSRPASAERPKPQEAPADYVVLPLYNEVQAAAGHGALVGNEKPDDALMFKEDWIRFELGARPSDLCLIRVSGDSMEPTLRAGDVILVDTRARHPDREGIYILRMDGMLLVKRIQAMPGSQLQVSSDNAAFAPWTIKLAQLAEADLAIIGRVVWSGRRL